MLISVKNAHEADLVCRYSGVSIVDLKDPAAGSLGFAGLAEALATAQAIDGRKRFSLACGELYQWQPEPPAPPHPQQSRVRFDLRILQDFPWHQIDFAKVGLAGYYGQANWSDAAADFFRWVPNTTRRVLVLYADQVAPSAAVNMILAAANIEFSVVLADTFDKTAGNLFAHWTADQCQQVFAVAERCGLQKVVAGSMTPSDFATAYRTGADWIGARGAVCGRDRASAICKNRLTQALKTAGIKSPA